MASSSTLAVFCSRSRAESTLTGWIISCTVTGSIIMGSRTINPDALLSELDHETLSQVAAPMDEDGSWKEGLLKFCCRMGQYVFTFDLTVKPVVKIAYTECIKMPPYLKRHNFVLKLVAAYDSESEIHGFDKIGRSPHSVNTPALALLLRLGSRGMTVKQLLMYLETLRMQRSQLPLRQKEALVITHHPLPLIELYEGQEMQLYCQAVGFPYPKYRWFHNQQLINGADSEHLTIPGVSVMNTGKYICQVYNEKEYTKSHCSMVTVHRRNGLPSQPGLLITVQPDSQHVLVRKDARLHYQVQGHGPLRCQWYRQVAQNAAVEELRSDPGRGIKIHDGDLIVHSAAPTHTASYWCSISDQFGNTVQTKRAELVVYQPLQVLEQPVVGQSIPIKGRAIFEVRINQKSPQGQVQYQWYHDGHPVVPDGRDVLQIQDVDSCQLNVRIHSHANQGRYMCKITSTVTNEDILSRESQLQVLDTPEQYTATLKVALLIGISHYQSESPLPAVENDLKLLHSKLSEIDFCVISLLDLERKEIDKAVEEFTKLLDRGVYGVLLLQGHGFESETQQVFWKPVDALPHSAEGCINTDEVLQNIRKKYPALALLMVDVCRRRMIGAARPNQLRCHGDRNTVVMYATGTGLESLERRKAQNGIFVDLLCQAIDSGKQDVRTLFMEIQRLLRLDASAAERMIPEMKFSLDEARSLHDPVDFTGNTTAVSARVEIWRNMHRVPERRKFRILNEKLEVDIQFDQELSNVLRMFIMVEDVPPVVRWDIVSYPNEISQPRRVSETTLQTNFDFTELQKLRGELRIELRAQCKLRDGQAWEEMKALNLELPLVAYIYRGESTA